MGKEKKCAIGLCCTTVIIVVLVGGGAAGWFLALSEFLLDTFCDTLKLLHRQVEVANDNLQDLLGDVKSDLGIEDPLDETSWLENATYYTRGLVTHTAEQEREYLEIYKDLFFPREEFDMVNDTREGNGQLGALVDDAPDPVRQDCPNTGRTPPPAGRRKRSGQYSRICPAYVPGTTQLVAFNDGGSGQMVQFNNNVQWVFNEECYRGYCSPGGCSCRKVRRQETALVYIFNSNGQLSGTPIQKTVYVHSCVAVV
ncbi:uncharacterized protein [Amphiura filiformis]|uniref:uncharacterized protein n=1 Tax=Amphiura filiformis TaxID=82378 RepID=UPI003B21EEF6